MGTPTLISYMHKILQQQLCTHPCKLCFFPNLCSILSKIRKSSDESLCTKTQQQQQQNVPVLVHCDQLLYQGHMTCHVAWSQANTEAFHSGIVHSLDTECNPLEKNRKEICIHVWSRKKQTLRKPRKRNLSSSSSSSSLHERQFTKERRRRTIIPETITCGLSLSSQNGLLASCNHWIVTEVL